MFRSLLSCRTQVNHFAPVRAPPPSAVLRAGCSTATHLWVVPFALPVAVTSENHLCMSRDVRHHDKLLRLGVRDVCQIHGKYQARIELRRSEPFKIEIQWSNWRGTFWMKLSCNDALSPTHALEPRWIVRYKHAIHRKCE